MLNGLNYIVGNGITKYGYIVRGWFVRVCYDYPRIMAYVQTIIPGAF